MVEGMADALSRSLATGSWMAPLAAFAGGAMTAANPCVLAMVPVMLAYAAGRPGQVGAWRHFGMSLAFAGGLTATFTVLFLLTWAVHGLLRSSLWTYFAAAVCLLMGLQMVGLLRVELPKPSWTPGARGVAGAVLLGMLFGLTSLPCAGPVLLALLAIVPTTGMAYGALLLAAYGLGHCILVIAAGTSVGFVERIVAASGLHHGLRGMKLAGGGLALLAGGYLLVFA